MTLNNGIKLLTAEIEAARSKTTTKLLVIGTILGANFIIVTVIDLRLSRSIYILKAWNKRLRYNLSCYNCS